MKENEREFQKWVTDTATANGWRWWHLPTPMRPIGGNKFVPDSRGRGFPDLVLFHENPPRLIFAEIKDEKGVISTEQAEFLRLARGVRDNVEALTVERDGGIDGVLISYYKPMGVFVWRPANRGLIEAVLAGAPLIQ